MKTAFWMAVCAAALFLSGLASIWWAAREGGHGFFDYRYLVSGGVLVVLSLILGSMAALGAMLLKVST